MRRSARGERTRAARQTLSPPNTESARALRALHVRPEQVAELADLPLAVVEAAIAHGRERDHVRDLAGWVVSLLRAHRDHGWPIPAPTPRSDSPEALRASFCRYAAEQARERQAEPLAESADDAPPGPAELDPPRLWDAALERLRAQIPRREFARWLRGTDLRALADGVAMIRAPSAAAKQAIESRYLGMLRADLAQLAGRPLTVRVALPGARPAGPARPPVSDADGSAAPEAGSGADDARPAWIAPAPWAALPALLRAALRGATLEGETIRTPSPHLDRLIRARYAREIAALIAASPP